MGEIMSMQGLAVDSPSRTVGSTFIAGLGSFGFRDLGSRVI